MPCRHSPRRFVLWIAPIASCAAPAAFACCVCLLPRSCSLVSSETVAVAASVALAPIAPVRDASRLRMLCSLAVALVLARELRGEVSSI